MCGHRFEAFHDVANRVESDTLGSVLAAFPHDNDLHLLLGSLARST